MNYRYLPAARRELARGMEYYEEKSVGLGGEFLDEVEAAISRIFSYTQGMDSDKTRHKKVLNQLISVLSFIPFP